MHHAPVDNWNYGNGYYHQGYQQYYPHSENQSANQYRGYSDSSYQTYKSMGYGMGMNSYAYNNYANHSPQTDNRGSSPYDSQHHGYSYNQQYASTDYNTALISNNNNGVQSADAYYMEAKTQYYQQQHQMQQQLQQSPRENTVEYKNMLETPLNEECYQRNTTTRQEDRSKECQVQQPSILSRALQGETSATLYSNRGGYYGKSTGPEAGRSPTSTSCGPADSPSPCLSSAASCESNLQAPITKMASGNEEIDCDNMAMKSETRAKDGAYLPWMKAAPGNDINNKHYQS